MEIRRPSQELTPELKNKIKERLQTPVWETREWIDIPAVNVKFNVVDRDQPEPEELKNIREKVWKDYLEGLAKAKKEQKPESEFVVRLDSEGEKATHRLALFEKAPGGIEARRDFDGPSLTMSDKGVEIKDGKAKVNVYPILYSEIYSCNSEEYREALKKHKMNMPDAGIGVVTIIETKDGTQPYSQRPMGIGTYPGRLHGFGGNPEPQLGVAENMLKELTEETGLEFGKHFDPSKLRVLAMVSDKHFRGQVNPRPELVAYLPVNVVWSELEEIHRKKQGESKEVDVWGITPRPGSVEGMRDTILIEGNRMCPPLEAGIATVMLMKTMGKEGVDGGIKKMDDLFSRMEKFERAEFKPPLKSLF